jgi:hypothetical protein
MEIESSEVYERRKYQKLKEIMFLIVLVIILSLTMLFIPELPGELPGIITFNNLRIMLIFIIIIACMLEYCTCGDSED